MKNLFFALFTMLAFGFSANAAHEINEIVNVNTETIKSVVLKNQIPVEKIVTVIDSNKSVVTDARPPRSITCWIVFIFSNNHCAD